MLSSMRVGNRMQRVGGVAMMVLAALGVLGALAPVAWATEGGSELGCDVTIEGDDGTIVCGLGTRVHIVLKCDGEDHDHTDPMLSGHGEGYWTPGHVFEDHFYFLDNIHYTVCPDGIELSGIANQIGVFTIRGQCADGYAEPPYDHGTDSETLVIVSAEWVPVNENGPTTGSIPHIALNGILPASLSGTGAVNGVRMALKVTVPEGMDGGYTFGVESKNENKATVSTATVNVTVDENETVDYSSAITVTGGTKSTSADTA